MFPHQDIYFIVFNDCLVLHLLSFRIILKEDAVKVLQSICQQTWKTQQWPQDWKRSIFIQILKKGNTKKCSNYHTIALISHAGKVMLEILQARLQQWTKNFQMFKLDLEKAEEPDIKLPTSAGSWKKQESSRKTSISAFLTMPKPLTMWITKKLWKILKEMGIPDHLTCLLRNLYAGQEATVQTGHSRLVPNWERSMSRLCIFTLLI